MWSEREITIAKQLQEPSTLAFLRKIFVETATNKGEVLASNVVALDDAEYGRIMKVVYLAKEENKAKINLIAKISNMKPIVVGEEKKVSTLAPR
jgi:hypothetical protein